MYSSSHTQESHILTYIYKYIDYSPKVNSYKNCFQICTEKYFVAVSFFMINPCRLNFAFIDMSIFIGETNITSLTKVTKYFSEHKHSLRRIHWCMLSRSLLSFNYLMQLNFWVRKLIIAVIENLVTQTIYIEIIPKFISISLLLSFTTVAILKR